VKKKERIWILELFWERGKRRGGGGGGGGGGGVFLRWAGGQKGRRRGKKPDVGFDVRGRVVAQKWMQDGAL
jgi:hypothetical protein